MRTFRRTRSGRRSISASTARSRLASWDGASASLVAGASRVVEELELAGYLERERRLDDRRVVKIRLRPASIAEVERAYRWRGDAVEAALAPFDDAERAVIQHFLRRVVDELRAAAAAAPIAAGEDHPGSGAVGG